MSWKTIPVCVMASMEKLSSDAVIICIIAYRMEKRYFPYISFDHLWSCLRPLVVTGIVTFDFFVSTGIVNF